MTIFGVLKLILCHKFWLILNFTTVNLFFDTHATVLIYNTRIKLIYLALIGLRKWWKSHFWNLENDDFRYFKVNFMSLIVINF